MSAKHESEVRDVMRQVLREMKGINGRLGRIETRQKQIEGNIALLVADENLQKLVTPQTAAKIQVQLFARNHSAVDRFCSTPELLENMLLKLPMQDLLLAQRVCSRFQATIAGSIKIRRALFFEPEPVTEHERAFAPRINPLLTRWSQIRRRRFLITELHASSYRLNKSGCHFNVTVTTVPVDPYVYRAPGPVRVHIERKNNDNS